jgi:RNA polymerase sigma factor (sigma-70 family)
MQKVSEAADLDAYVHRIVFNTLASARRRRWNSERPTAAVPDQAGREPYGEVDLVDVLLRALGTLAEGQREVIVLRYYAHLSEARTAEVLGISPGTVKSRTARALARLAQSPELAEEREAR